MHVLWFTFIFHFYTCSATDDAIVAYGNSCTNTDTATYTCNYIPKDIPTGVTRVYLELSAHDTPTVLNNSTFMTNNWSKVQYLEFNGPPKATGKRAEITLVDGCFKELKMLQELHIHNCIPNLSHNTFIGLNTVNTLDMSDCAHLSMEDLKPALNGSNKLPRLNKLVLSNWNFYTNSYRFDNKLVQILLPRNITHIDISNSDILLLNFTAVIQKLTHLEVFNASYTTINDISFDSTVIQDKIKHIRLFDLAHATLPKRFAALIPGKLIISNITTNYSKFHHNEWFLTLETVNISGIVPHVSSIWIENCTVILDRDPLWYTKTLVLKWNNLRRMNAKLICYDFNISSIQFLDLSDNGMEFIHPTILSCMPNLRTVDLSKNQLYKMVQEDIMLFEKLISGLKHLKSVILSENGLHDIPLNMFQNQRYIEQIDLSHNTLDQVTFTLRDLDNLKVLDIQGNNIHILDTLSMDHLSSIPHGTDSRGYRVILTSNPISCSECKAKPFLQWLLSTNEIDTTSQKLSCFNEDGKEEAISDNTVEIVQRICNRKTIIISASVSAGVILLIVTTCTTIIYKRNKVKQKIQNRINVKKLLREGDGQYEFGVFLSFSNEDEKFVNTHVLTQLNETLRLKTGVDRELVCTGDRHFRPGFYIHNEAFRSLDTAAVLMVVVSNNFCNSVYCRNELDQAYVKQKPIVLMIMEHIDQEAMMPTMKELYQNNVRILWTVENGDYVLKTTWENVCTSILDLIQCDI